jgi:hypothetical protein
MRSPCRLEAAIKVSKSISECGEGLAGLDKAANVMIDDLI